MNKKVYKVELDWDRGITVEVDHDLVTDEVLTGINKFWCGSEYRLQISNGDVLNAVLRMLCVKCLTIEFSNNYNLTGVIQEFDYENYHGCEGWPKMDGSQGFRLIDIDPLSIEYDDLTVQEL